MKTKTRTVGLMLGAAALVLGIFLAQAAVQAAVVEGSDQKAVKAPAGLTQTLNVPGRRRREPPSPNPASAAAAPATAGSVSGSTVIGEKEFNSCKKFPSGKRIVKLNRKPDTELGDLISWISSITCK